VVRRQLDQARAQNITQSSLPTEELQATTFDVLAMQAAVRAAPRSDGQRSAPRAPDSGPTQPALAGGREVATLPAAPAAPAVTPSKVGEPRRSAPALTGEARSGLETRGVPGARAAPEARGALGTTPQARSAFEPSGEPATAPRLTPADDVEPRALGTTPQARPAFEPSGEPGTAPRLTPADDVEPRALGTTPQARPAFEPSGEPGTAPRLTPADDVEPRADVTQQVRLRLQPERPPPRPSALRSALWGGLAALVLAALAAAAWLAFKPQPAPPAPTPKPLHPLTAEPANGP
jgi:hypothetical protein